MLETILKLYVASMAGPVTSPMPHLFGPPGTGKSSVVAEAARLLGVDMHTINVSRISPLELEGVQMPDKEHAKLNLLTATFWTQLKEGDILLLDEFLRGFPEVYNGLLDILTSRQVGHFKLPKVFIIGASNSTVAYDKALEDRLLHIPVPDVRKTSHQKAVAQRITEELGLLPKTATTMEMADLISYEIAPMYEMLDSLKGKQVTASSTAGHSVRNLIGQVRLRHVITPHLKALLNENNRLAIVWERKPQYVILTDQMFNQPWFEDYKKSAAQLRGNDRLTKIQAANLELNLQLIDLEAARSENKESTTDDESYRDFF